MSFVAVHVVTLGKRKKRLCISTRTIVPYKGDNMDENFQSTLHVIHNDLRFRRIDQISDIHTYLG